MFLRAVPLLYLLVIVFQFRSINLAWLTPLFGSGAHALVHSARLCATYYCMIPIGMLLDDGENTTGRGRAYPARPVQLFMAVPDQRRDGLRALCHSQRHIPHCNGHDGYALDPAGSGAFQRKGAIRPFSCRC